MNHWRIINSLEKEGRKNSTIINPSLISIGVTWRRKKTVNYGHPKHGNRSQLIHPITVNNTRNTRPRRYRAYKKGARIDCSARGREEHELFIRASQVNYYHLPLPSFLPFHNPFFSTRLSANQSERSSVQLLLLLLVIAWIQYPGWGQISTVL